LKNFDPLGLASVGSDETFAWFQAAELKHSRAAMLATTGFLIQAAGIHFPGMLSKDVSFESLSSMNPVEQWANVPDAGTSILVACCLWTLNVFIWLEWISSHHSTIHHTLLLPTGKAQIVGTILIAELATEAKKPHYMMGGDLPTIVFPKVDFSNVNADTLKTKRSRELNNGRLAMIAIMSFLAEHAIPGSVPVLTGIDAF
jgi:hypothetical protein